MQFTIEKEGSFDLSIVHSHLTNSPDGKYSVTVKRIRERRSLNQNDFYWGPFLDSICDHIGETFAGIPDDYRDRAKKQVHEWLKDNFTEQEIFLPTGEIICTPGSTSEYDTKEFEEYLENIRMFFGSPEGGWVLPYPDDGDPYKKFKQIRR